MNHLKSWVPKNSMTYSAWCFNQAIWKICTGQKFVHLPQGSGWKFEKIFELPPASYEIIPIKLDLFCSSPTYSNFIKVLVTRKFLWFLFGGIRGWRRCDDEEINCEVWGGVGVFGWWNEVYRFWEMFVSRSKNELKKKESGLFWFWI